PPYVRDVRLGADIEREEDFLRGAEQWQHDLSVARVADVATAIERGVELVVPRAPAGFDHRVLELPDEIRLVVEADQVADLDRATDALGARRDREAVAEVEALRESAAGGADARAALCMSVRGRQ